MSKLEVTTKNSKNEILEAYESILQELEEAKKLNKQALKREQEKTTTILSASQNTASSIVQELANLKLNIVKSLEEVESSLLSENKKLSTLQEAIKLQSKDLEDLHQIKLTANTLEALLLTQKQKKESFEEIMLEQTQNFDQEVAEKRALWKQEQEQAANLWREQESLQKKLRQREEEDYAYKRDLDRKKDKDNYAIQKQILEKDLADKKLALEQEFAAREAALLTKEQELQELKLQAQEAPQKLQQAIIDTEKAVTERLHFKHDYEIKLAQKEVEGDKRLYRQMVTSLETKIQQQEQQIKELTEKNTSAGLQVQQIAVKAIESASGQRFCYTNNDKVVELNKDDNKQRT